jgi:hypothetical protein
MGHAKRPDLLPWRLQYPIWRMKKAELCLTPGAEWVPVAKGKPGFL